MSAMLALSALIVASAFGDWISGLWGGPLHLSCHGRFATEYQGDQRAETKTLHVEVDLKNSTVSVESFFPLFKITSDGSEVVKFGDDSLGKGYSSDGHLNRYTGAIVVISLVPAGGFFFDGLCQRAERLF